MQLVTSHPWIILHHAPFCSHPKYFHFSLWSSNLPQLYQKPSGSDNPKSAFPLTRGTKSDLSFHFFGHGFLLTHFPFSLLLLCKFGSSFLWDFSCLQSPIFLPFSTSCLLPFFSPSLSTCAASGNWSRAAQSMAKMLLPAPALWELSQTNPCGHCNSATIYCTATQQN